MTLALGILVSGTGSNMQAIIDAIFERRLDAVCKLVVSNRPGARALTRAKNCGIPVRVVDHKEYGSRAEFDQQLIATLKEAGVEWVALAGFMRVLGAEFLDTFRDRVINIHPSLLPAFPGVAAQKQALDYGVRVAGCTVHFVEQGVDSGPIIMQRSVPVLPDDTEDTLKSRILKEEHRVFVEALSLLAQGRVSLAPNENSPRRRVLIEERK